MVVVQVHKNALGIFSARIPPNPNDHNEGLGDGRLQTLSEESWRMINELQRSSQELQERLREPDVTYRVICPVCQAKGETSA